MIINNESIKELLSKITALLDGESNSFDQQYYCIMTRTAAYGLETPDLQRVLSYKNGLSISDLHKVSVLYKYFFENTDNAGLRYYIIDELTLLFNQAISKYTLKQLYLLYCSARKVDYSPAIDRACLEYIERFLNEDGSYSNFYTGKGNIGATYDALFLNYWINHSFSIKPNTIQYIKSCYTDKLGFSKDIYSSRYSISSMFDGYFLSTKFSIDINDFLSAVVNYIVFNYQKFNNKQLFQSSVILKCAMERSLDFFDRIY